MLRPDGGVIDDLIACYLDEKFPRGGQCRHGRQGSAWIKEHAKQIDITRAAARPRDDRGAGPECAREGPLCRWSPRPRARSVIFSPRHSTTWFVSRTGYTGEDGFEVALPAEAAAGFGIASAAGVDACGLGARDTLRLEAGMNLYGHDMDEA